jgi:hypothetical protein
MFDDANALKWIIACGGWLVAVFLAYLGYAERKANQKAELLLKTVSYFEGKTQKRSIGIALVEGLLRKNSEHIGVLVPLLTNQFVYLLLHPDVKDSVHEERNLVRLFHLLEEIPSLRAQQEHHDSWCEVGDAIGRWFGGERSGLRISEPTLKQWLKTLGHSEPT